MSESLSAQRDRIDGLILRLERQLRELRRQRNTLTPLGLLPPELLLETFYYCREQAVVDRHWVREVTHVCHDWRDIALSSSALWSEPEFFNPVLGTLMLQRSGMSPLSVHFHWDSNSHGRPSTEVLEFLGQTIVSEAHRIRELNLVLPRDCLSQLLAYAMGLAPLLKKLCLGSQLLSDDDDVVLDIPDNLFAGAMSNLCELTLPTCRFNLMPTCCQNLHTLYIEDANLPSVVYLHTALRSMQQLKKLCIHNAFNPAVPPGYMPSPIYIPSLVELYITDSASYLVAILAPLKCLFPDLHSPQSLSISCTDAMNTSVDQMSQISSWLASSVSAPLTGLSLDGCEWSVHAFTNHEHPHNDEEEFSPLELELVDEDGGLTNWLAWSLVQAYTSHLSLTHIEYLVISASVSSFPDDTWAAILMRTPNLTTLKVKGDCADIILCALGRNPPTVPLLPRLRCIILKPVDSGSDLFGWANILHSRMCLDDANARATMVLHGRDSEPMPLVYMIVADYQRLQLRWNGQNVERGLACRKDEMMMRAISGG